MKRILVAFAIIFSAMQIQAQEFQGMAVYESKTSTSNMSARFAGNRDFTPEMQKMMEERMKKMLEKTFILSFDKTASIYKEEEKLDAPGQQGGGARMMSSMMGGGGTFYKNVKQKAYAVDREFMGKEFLIKDSLPKLEWKLEGETKQIGGYTCYKATAIKPVSKSDFRNFRPKEEKKDDKKVEKEKSTNFMDDLEMPKEVAITAWYAPEIPVNQGPENYWGLPGLILEVSDGKTVILCSKIVLNPKEKATIKEPTKGKVITQNEYDETVTKKMQEMREQFKSNGGRPSFRIGN